MKEFKFIHRNLTNQQQLEKKQTTKNNCFFKKFALSSERVFAEFRIPFCHSLCLFFL